MPRYKKSGDIDAQIASLEKALGALKAQKLREMEAQVERYRQAMLAGYDSPKVGRPRKGVRGPQLSDEEVLERLTKAIKGAGAGGISARAAAIQGGVFYPRALKALRGNFKQKGAGKWSRYFLK
jgi:hypothetical protein